MPVIVDKNIEAAKSALANADIDEDRIENLLKQYSGFKSIEE